MITIKDAKSIALMREAGLRLLEIFKQLPMLMQAGVTTSEIDAFINKCLTESQLVSTMKGYMGYGHVSCVSINDVIVHGVPNSYKLKRGDFVKVDVCASYKGYCADMARSFTVELSTPDTARLANTAQEALDAGIAQMVPGNRLSNISYAIQQVIERDGFGVVREFAGHGIGKKMHEDPEILNYGKPNRGLVLKPGMVFALEPMLTFGSYKCYIAADGWTARTVDGSVAAHVEDTVAVVEDGFLILTR